MWRRARVSALRGAAAMGTTRLVHTPGWKTRVSTKDARTREQREADRKARQIEKLPRPEALPDFQYPYEKTVLSDYMFQYPVYENELDTPYLFNLTPPPSFFLYWNVSCFERTEYPAVPALDHRLLVPNEECAAWQTHRDRVRQYLRKHELHPHYIPHIKLDVNLSVVFAGQYRTRARTPAEEDALAAGTVDAGETGLTPRNFWFTAHCGNYVELAELQKPPSVYFFESQPRAAHGVAAPLASFSAAAHEGQTGPVTSYYTFMIVCPDYPYRVPSYDDRGKPEKGFFLHYLVANLPGGAVTAVSDMVTGPTAALAKRGDVVIPYVPPLPTEDAGTARIVCLLFRQSGKVPHVVPLSPENEERHFPLAARSRFRLHDPARERLYGATAPTAVETERAACLASLRAVERVLPPSPSAVTFLQTKWDIHVQEFYEKLDLPEPAAPVDEEIEALLEYHARPAAELRVRARHRPDGSTNIGNDPDFWAQSSPTRMMDGSMQSLWSRRTALGANGVPVVYPHPPSREGQ